MTPKIGNRWKNGQWDKKFSKSKFLAKYWKILDCLSLSIFLFRCIPIVFCIYANLGNFAKKTRLLFFTVFLLLFTNGFGRCVYSKINPY